MGLFKWLAEVTRFASIEDCFDGGLSKSEFEALAYKASKNIKRLSISVVGPIIYGTVKSQSGISEWHFKLDFNDYGHITGKYWASSDNGDSAIPKRLGDVLAALIRNYDPEKAEEKKSSSTSRTKKEYGRCPYCGEVVTMPCSLFCSFCGKQLYK